MSERHPVIAVTGSSGAGTTTVKTAFEHIFLRERVTPCVIEGDSFHRFDRREMRSRIEEAEVEGRTFSHFGPEANLLEDLESLFREYGESGTGHRRYYVHSEEEGNERGAAPGTFTEWEPVPGDSHLLFYEGLHGAATVERVNVARYVDLLIGVVPIVNLEWIQKIHRDTAERGYTREYVTNTILRRMHDYVHYIIPQFSRTDINFQRVPTVDTSDPFVARDIPTADESMVVIRFRDPAKFDIDFPYLLAMIKDSYMSRRNNIVIPGGKMGFAMEIVFEPILDRMMQSRRRLLKLG